MCPRLHQEQLQDIRGHLVPEQARELRVEPVAPEERSLGRRRGGGGLGGLSGLWRRSGGGLGGGLGRGLGWGGAVQLRGCGGVGRGRGCGPIAARRLRLRFRGGLGLHLHRGGGLSVAVLCRGRCGCALGGCGSAVLCGCGNDSRCAVAGSVALRAACC